MAFPEFCCDCCSGCCHFGLDGGWREQTLQSRFGSSPSGHKRSDFVGHSAKQTCSRKVNVLHCPAISLCVCSFPTLLVYIPVLGVVFFNSTESNPIQFILIQFNSTQLNSTGHYTLTVRQTLSFSHSRMLCLSLSVGLSRHHLVPPQSPFTDPSYVSHRCSDSGSVPMQYPSSIVRPKPERQYHRHRCGPAFGNTRLHRS